MTELKSTTLATRMTPSMKKAFIEKAKAFGDPSDILRELVEGFIEDRLTIQPPTKGIYHVLRKED